MRIKYFDPSGLTILKHAILFPVFFLSIVFLIFSFSATVAWAAAPPTPTNLTATAASSKQINLSWKDNATTETNYYVERSQNGSSSWTVIATLGANITSYQNTGLTQNTTYYYRVRCKAGSTYSSYSNTANTKTATLATPTALNATVASASQVTLAWTDNTAYESQYSIERSPNGSSSWTVIGTVATNVTTTNSSGLTAGTAYYYRVRAFDSTNYSAYSNTANQTIRTITASAGANGTIAPSGTVGVASGSTKSFTMTPNSSYKIATVTVDGSSVATNPTYSFSNITANHTIAATFSAITYTITASAGANGSISPTGAYSVSSGGTATFTITPVSNYHVANVLVDGASKGVISSFTFTHVIANHTIAASFAINTFTVTPSVTGGSGTINPSTQQIVSYGSNTAFTMTPNSGKYLSNLSVDGSSVATASTYTFTNVTANHTIAATFSAITYTITASAGANGSISPTGAYSVSSGGTATFTMTPVTNYHVANVIVDGASKGVISSFTFTNVLANHTISASFAINTFSVTPSVTGGSGSINPSTQQIVSYGSNTAFAITPNSGKYLSNLSVDGSSVATNPTYTFSNITANHTIAATFSAITYTITASAGANGSISPNGAYSVSSGGTTTFTMTPIANYHVADVVVDSVSKGTITSFTFTNVISNHTITASFAINTFTVTPSVTGNGSITPSTQQIVSYGSNTTFTMTPNSGKYLSNLSVDGSSVATNPTYTFSNITANHTIAATFSAITYTITASAGANGSISPTGAYSVSSGGTATFTITPVANYHVANVLVDGASKGVISSFTFTNVIANHTIAASFSINTFTVTPSVTGGSGIINPSTQQIVSYGSNTAFAITPNSGNYLSNLSVDGSSIATASTYTFSNVTANHTIAATFSANTYSITASAGANGKISPSGIVNVVSGATATYTITSATGYHVADVLVDGVSVGVVGSYTFASVTTSHTITASFVINTYTITITASAGANGTISPSGIVNVVSGATTTFTLTPNTGYSVSNVQVDGVSIGAVSSYTFTNVTANHTISVSFTNTGPVVSTTSPVAGFTNNKTPTLTYTVSKGTVVVKVDNIVVPKVSGNTLGPFSDGQHKVYVEARDASGFLGIARVTFTVDTEPPLTGAMPVISKIAVGQMHSLAIATDGSLWTWGDNSFSQLGDGIGASNTWPEKIGTDLSWSRVAASSISNVALKSDGTLWAWGDNENGQLGNGNTNFINAPIRIGADNNWKAISPRGYHSVALKDDGTLWAWGANGNGQLGDGSTVDTFIPKQIGTDTNWISIAGGYSHTVALKTNGTLWAWGYNWAGQLGDGSTVDNHTPIQIGTDTDWAAISAGEVHTVALKTNGTLWAWGYNESGQLGDDSAIEKHAPVQIGSDSDWAAISAGASHTAALKTNGALWAWGANWTGQIGDGTLIDKYVPTRIGTDTNWAAISAEVAHTLALKTDGTLWTWGDNEFGQLGDGTKLNSLTPHTVGRINGSDNPFVINKWANATNNRSITLTMNAWDLTGTVAFMKLSNNGTTWNAAEPYVSTKAWTLTSGDGTKTVYAKFQDAAGNWSSSFSSSIILDTVAPVVTIVSPTAGTAKGNLRLLSYSVNEDISIETVTLDGVVVDKWSGATLDPLADGPHTLRVDVIDYAGNPGFALVAFTTDATPPMVNITSPTVGVTTNTTPLLNYTVDNGTVRVKVDGIVVNKVSGNTLGSLAEGVHTLLVEATDAVGNISIARVVFTVDTSPPVATLALKFWKISSGGNHSTALANNGSLWAWGLNSSGQVGDGTTDYSKLAPTQIGTEYNWSVVSAGDLFTLAIKSDGTLWTWGSNSTGNLGDGSTTEKRAPVQIGTDTDWVAVSGGGTRVYDGYWHSTNHAHTVAIKSDGSLWTWGDNSSGQLGDGTYNPIYVPHRIGTDTDWAAVSAGGQHTLALKTDGTLWAWGDNFYGQLGEGDYQSSRPSLFRIGTDTNWTAISAGRYHSVALKSDGTLWTWGDNFYLQLGDGKYGYQYVPERIGTAANWATISAKDINTVALKSDGTLWWWGYSVSGPTQIGTDTNWSAVSAGYEHALALKNDRTLWAWGRNNYGQLGILNPSGSGPQPVDNLVGSNNPIAINNSANYTNNASVTLNLSAFDAATYVAFMKIKNEGSTWSGPVPYATTMNWTVSPGDGIKTVSVMFEDAVGHWSSEYSASIIRDTVTPTVMITSPVAGMTNNKTSLLTYTASDGTVIVKVDGRVVNKVSGNTLDALSDGSHTVRIEATDAANNTGFAEVTFTVVSIVPTVTITSPPVGATNNRTPMLIYSVSDGTVVVKVDGIVVNKVSGNTLDSLLDGTHTVRVEATNSAVTGFAEVTFTVDTIAPTVTITSPSVVATNNRSPMLTYTCSDGTVVVKVDGVVVNKVSGNALDALSEGSHIVQVEATDAVNNTGFATVTFTVDTVVPTVSITSPSGYTNSNTLLLIYTVSDGAVVVKVDGNSVNKVSGDTLDPLTNGDHTVRVEAGDAANNIGFAEVTFTVDTSSAGNDDTNIYCMGTGTYPVGYSNFTSSISVPVTNNEVRIASPLNYATIYGPKTIIKGAMDTTIPVSTVSVLITNSTGSAIYLAKVNGKYFAEQVSLSAGDNTITVTATDQNSGKHQASIIVTGVTQIDDVTLQAAPNTGIMTLKQNGRTTLDVFLASTASIQYPVANYAWDFNGTGANSLTCYSHSNVTASYQQTGLYLTTVNVTDTAGNHCRDAVIVNVLDRNSVDAGFKQIWNGLKTALSSSDITTLLSYLDENSKISFQQQFTALLQELPQFAATLGDINLVNISTNFAEYEFRSVHNEVIYSFQLLFVRESDGSWKIRSF